jgi:cytochrome P450
MPLTPPKDPIAAVIHPDPYPYYADLVAHQPLYYDEALKLWVASSAEAVTAVLTSELCRVRPTTEPVPRTIVDSASGIIFQHLIRMNDGESHDPMKQAVSATLHMGLMDQIAAQSRQCADALFNSLQLTTSYERMMDFAFHLPVYVVASLLGVPERKLAQTALWVGDFVRGIAPGGTLAQIEQGKEAAHQLREMMRELATNAHESLMTSMVRESLRIGQNNPDVIAANAIGLMMQSYDATAGLIANTLRLFATHPAIYAQVKANPCLLRSALQEVLRYDSPVQNTRRFVAQDGSIAGKAMKAGDTILVVLAAANRDAAANPHPQQFDLCRMDRCLFTFGIGGHACPGEMMAVAIAQAAIERIFASGMTLEHWAGSIAYRPSVNARIALLDSPHLSNNIHYYC